MPKPNKAKSYFTGSVGSNLRRLLSSSASAFASFCFRDIRPSFRATFPECTSSGQDNAEDGIVFQIPRSTPLLSFLTIHRKYMLIRLAAELFKGSEMCFLPRVWC